MPVLDILGLLKIGARAIVWVLMSPFSLIAFVIAIVVDAYQKIEQFSDRLYYDFLINVVQAPMEYLNTLLFDQQNTFFSWIAYTFAFDHILPFLYHLPSFVIWFIKLIVLFVVGFVSTVVVLYCRQVLGRCFNTLFSR